MVTLDIEDNAIKILTVSGTAIKGAFQIPLEPGLVKDGVVLSAVEVGQKIKELFQQHNINEKNVIASVSGIHSIYRVTRLPKLPGDLMAEAVKREMSRTIPVPLEELYTSWQAIPVNKEEYVVPLIGIPRETLDFMLASLKQAGLSSRLVDIRPLALSRLTGEKDAIIIDVQPYSFDIVLMVNGIPEIIRSLPFSDSQIPSESKVQEVREELDRTVSFYNNSKPANLIDESYPVFITGYYKDVLAKIVGYPVKTLPELLSYPAEFNVDEYIVNIGLALRQNKSIAAYIKPNINVIPEKYLPKKIPIVSIISWLFIVLAIVILGFTAMNMQQAMAANSALRVQINNLNAQIERQKTDQAEIDRLKVQLQTLNTDKATLESVLGTFENQRSKINQELGEIISLVPGKITIKTISYSAEWTITGTTSSSGIILGYVESLQTSDQFSSVQLTNMQEVQFSQWNFTATIIGSPLK